MPSRGPDFAAGRDEGKQDARLDGHDDRLAAINGNIRRMGDEFVRVALEMNGVALQIQAMRDESKSRDLRVEATAKALADAATALREKLEAENADRQRETDRRGAGFTRRVAIIGILLVVVGLVLGYVYQTRMVHS